MDKNKDGVYPAFVGKASLTSDGFVICNFLDKEGRMHMGAFVVSWDDVLRNASGLSSHLGLSLRETAEMGAVIGGWVNKV